MSKKTERVEIYVDEDMKQAIESAADRADMTRSSWLRTAAERQLRQQEQGELTAATEAEERIERLIAEARDTFEEQSEQIADEIATATQEYHDLLAVSGVYSIAGFRLLGDYGDFSDPQRRAAIDHGVERMKKWPVDVDPDEITADGDRSAGDSTRAETRAEGDSDRDSDDSTDSDDGPSDTGVL
jgi:hypothetical protein